MKIKMWHWRDILCWIKLKTSIGYKVRELCGKCEKCNGIFAATGVIPCPMRFNNKLKNEVPNVTHGCPAESCQAIKGRKSADC